MKRREFEQRWRRLARRARLAEPGLPEAPGHAVPGWMRARPRWGRGGDLAGGEIWEGLAWRGVAAAALVLLASVWFAWSGGVGREEQRLLPPRLEQAVAEGFWLL